MDLKRFEVGRTYDVATRLAVLLLAERWAEPVPDEQPALLVPVLETHVPSLRVTDASDPPNLIRETYPPYLDQMIVGAADLKRRSRRRGTV